MKVTRLDGFGYRLRHKFIPGACPPVPTLIHLFSHQNKSCNNCPFIKQCPWHSSYIFTNFPEHGCYSRKQQLHLRVLWDAFKGNGREEREETILRCLHRLSAHYNSSHSCFSKCCFCAWWYLKELLILEGATASSEYTHVIFGFTLVIRFCCDFSKCTCLVRRYQKYLKHMIMEQFLLPEIFLLNICHKLQVFIALAEKCIS